MADDLIAKQLRKQALTAYKTRRQQLNRRKKTLTSEGNVAEASTLQNELDLLNNHKPYFITSFVQAALAQGKEHYAKARARLRKQKSTFKNKGQLDKVASVEEQLQLLTREAFIHSFVSNNNNQILNTVMSEVSVKDEAEPQPVLSPAESRRFFQSPTGAASTSMAHQPPALSENSTDVGLRILGDLASANKDRARAAVIDAEESAHIRRVVMEVMSPPTTPLRLRPNGNGSHVVMTPGIGSQLPFPGTTHEDPPQLPHTSAENAAQYNEDVPAPPSVAFKEDSWSFQTQEEFDAHYLACVGRAEQMDLDAAKFLLVRFLVYSIIESNFFESMDHKDIALKAALDKTCSITGATDLKAEIHSYVNSFREGMEVNYRKITKEEGLINRVKLLSAKILKVHKDFIDGGVSLHVELAVTGEDSTDTVVDTVFHRIQPITWE